MTRSLPLPRLLTVLVVTAVAAALVLSFRSTPHIQKGRLAKVQPAAAPPRAPAAPARHKSRAAPQAPATRRVTSTTVMTDYGPVQVRVTVRGAKILSITNLALPFDRSRSQEISQIAGPMLRSEALAAQSARINVISGATYTSNGYAQALQSALDRAGA